MEGRLVFSFAHQMPTRIVAGAGSVDRLAEELADISRNRNCLLVTGRRAARLSGTLKRVQDILAQARVEPALFDQVEPNPTIETVMEGAELARSTRARWVFALGGGSAIDAAKAIALMAVSQEDIRDFFKGMRPSQTPLPLVAVPTTAGSGSEVTPYASVTDVSAGDKFSLAMDQLFPRLTILDPAVTLTMPESVTVDTGLGTLCHAIEALFSSRRSVLSDLFARSALDRVVHHLPTVRAEADNLRSRSEMQLAASFAGMAIADTATLVPEALGHPVTVRYDLPHGRVTALLMPAFLARLADQEPERVAFVGRVLGTDKKVPRALRAFVESLGVAPRLGAYGVHEQDIEIFSRQARNKTHIQRTPGRWHEDSLRELYHKAL